MKRGGGAEVSTGNEKTNNFPLELNKHLLSETWNICSQDIS